MSLAVLSSIALLILGVLLVPDDAFTDVPNDYCYDQAMEGYVCFENPKMCEREQKDDLLGESECYDQRE